MAFALTDCKFYELHSRSATKRRGLQVIELTVTRGAAGDVDFDYGDVAGTFWTDAVANGTTGALARKALDAYRGGIDQNIVSLVSHELTANNGFSLRASSTSATQHTLTNNDTFPIIEPVVTFANNAAPATVKLVAVFALADDKQPVTFSY
jgi:hypothetical protein